MRSLVHVPGLRLRRRHFRGVSLWLIAAIVSLPPLALGAQGDIAAAARLLQDARRADSAGDVATYLRHARDAARLIPPHPVVQYHLARAAARNAQHEDALAALAGLVPLGTPRDPAADSAFQPLWDRPRFRSVLTDIARAAEPLIRSDTAFLLDVPNAVPENLAFDSVQRVFYVGSIARRAILRADSGGRTAIMIGPDADIGQPLGMRVDASSRTLWVAAIWPADSAGGRPVQRSALLEIEIPSGRIRRRYTPPDTTRAHLLNDLVLGPRGELYVTDSDAATIYTLMRGDDRLREWVRLPPTVIYPNGIALSADDRTVFVAHQTGILAIDVASRRIVPLESPADASFLGIDGLYLASWGLVGVQNTGVMNHQVIGIRLGRERSGEPSVACASVLERRHPAYDIPTTGVRVGAALLYIANSQLTRIDPQGRLRDPERMQHTVILRLPIDRLAGCS
jgi:hypothetical protein